MTLLWYPRMEKTNHKSNGGYAWAEESLLPGGTSPFIVSNDDDDDLVSVRELFVRVEPAPAAATTTSAAGTHKRQISEAVPQDERPNKPETIPAPPPQRQASRGGGVPRRPRRQIQAQARAPARVAGPGSPNGAIEVQLLSNCSANSA
jgi:hypothetical protein